MRTDCGWKSITPICTLPHNLARAKSYKDVEPTGVPIEAWYYCHAEKIAALDLAVFFLARFRTWWFVSYTKASVRLSSPLT